VIFLVSDLETTLQRLSLADFILSSSLVGWIFAVKPLVNRISFIPSKYAIFALLIGALILVFTKLRVKSIKKKLIEDMQQGMGKAVANLHSKIPLTDNDFTLATKFGKSIAFLASDLPQQFLDDEWQWLDPTDKETYVPKAHYSDVVNAFERDLTTFTLRNHDGESHLELSYIVFILQNPEKFSPNQGYANGGVDGLIDCIQEAADISGWDELEEIINRIDLTDFRTSPMYS
jgi:hypothetical protein